MIQTILTAVLFTTVTLANIDLDHPTIHITILASNKAKWLPFTLSLLESQDYPKSRLSIEFFTDHNSDNTAEVIDLWVSKPETIKNYASINVVNNRSIMRKLPLTWEHEERHRNVLQIRQNGLENARESKSDFFVYWDADILISNPNMLKKCIDDRNDRDWVVKAPFLQSNSIFSNFWGAQDTSTGYYKRSDDYESIYNRDIPGVWEVPVVHSLVFINLRKTESNRIQFFPIMPNYPYWIDEVVAMSYNFKKAGVSPVIDTREVYGTIGAPIDELLQDDYVQLSHTLSEVLIESPVGFNLDIIPAVNDDFVYPKKLTDFGFDRIFCINLLRRPDRKAKMEKIFKLHGIGPVEFPGAVDGHKITQEYLDENGIRPLAGFVDPFHKRTLTKGEIGCFLSHWRLWLHVVKYKHERILILEDDLRLELNFNNRFAEVMKDIDTHKPDWDLMYLGRKKLQLDEPEEIPYGAKDFVIADYSYWTLGYAISYKGAKKLIEQAPLDRLVPVDEYLPIMFDKHDRQSLLEQFSPRDLQAYSAEPLLVYPTHYVGQKNYISDTELSGLWEEAKVLKDELKGEIKVGGLGAPGPSSVEEDVYARVAVDQRFTLEEVVKNFDKWEGDMSYLCDNKKANVHDLWMKNEDNLQVDYGGDIGISERFGTLDKISDEL